MPEQLHTRTRCTHHRADNKESRPAVDAEPAAPNAEAVDPVLYQNLAQSRRGGCGAAGCAKILHTLQKEQHRPTDYTLSTKRAAPTAPTCNPIESDRGRVDDADHRQQHPDKMGRQ